MKAQKKLIAISAPSGGGKSVVTRHLIKLFPDLMFSISATTRHKREMETHGKEYFFIEKDKFEEMIRNDELIEYEQIFGNYYGTLKSEVEKILSADNIMIFDIDVKGALALQKAFPNDTLLIFLAPPSINVLQTRLNNRKTETAEQIANRIARAKMEIEMSKDFDFVVVNEILTETFKAIEKIFRENITD